VSYKEIFLPFHRLRPFVLNTAQAAPPVVIPKLSAEYLYRPVFVSELKEYCGAVQLPSGAKNSTVEVIDPPTVSFRDPAVVTPT